MAVPFVVVDGEWYFSEDVPREAILKAQTSACAKCTNPVFYADGIFKHEPGAVCFSPETLERQRIKQMLFDQFKTLSLFSKCCAAGQGYLPFSFAHASSVVQDFAFGKIVADVAFLNQSGQALGVVQVNDQEAAVALRALVPLVFNVKDDTFVSSLFRSQLELCQSCGDKQAAMAQTKDKRKAREEQEALQFKDELVRACPVFTAKPEFDPRPKINKAMARCSFCTMAFCVDKLGPLCPTCDLYTVEACARCPQNPKECFTHLPHVCMSACREACKYAVRDAKKAKKS